MKWRQQKLFRGREDRRLKRGEGGRTRRALERVCGLWSTKPAVLSHTLGHKYCRTSKRPTGEQRSSSCMWNRNHLTLTQTYGRTDGRGHKQTDTDRRTHEDTDRRTDTRGHRQTDGHTRTQTDGRTHEDTNRRKYTRGHTNTDTNRRTHEDTDRRLDTQTRTQTDGRTHEDINRRTDTQTRTQTDGRTHDYTQITLGSSLKTIKTSFAHQDRRTSLRFVQSEHTSPVSPLPRHLEGDPPGTATFTETV